MQTKCPQCTIIFKLSEELLSLADDQVRCSNCKHVFNGRQHLIDDSKPHKQAIDKIVDFSVVDIKQRILGKKNSHKMDYFWVFSFVFASLLFVIQILWLNRSSLVEHPKLGNRIKIACERLSFCNIPAKRDNKAFSLSARQIYSHPNEDNALILSASFINDADFAQPFPLLLVSMSDKQGEVIAERYFTPEEYRATENDHITLLNNYSAKKAVALMQSNESINISLSLADPGKDALAFEIDFL